MKHYFISYVATSKQGGQVFGSLEVCIDFKINSMADLKKISAEIAFSNELEKVVVLNYQLFK